MGALPDVLVRWVVMAAIGAALWGYGYVSGLRSEADRHTEFAASVASAGARQEARTAAAVRNQRSITQQTETTYVQGNDAVRRLYGPGRVRKPETDPRRGELPAIPQAAGEPDAATANPGPGAALPAAGEDPCGALKSDAAVTTRELLFLQDWIRQQQAAMNGGTQ